MTEPTLNRIDSLASFLEATNDLGNVVGVPVSQAELSVRIILTNRVNEPLHAQEEPEVVAAGNPCDFDSLAERHPNWDGILLAALGKWPCERISRLSASQ